MQIIDRFVIKTRKAASGCVLWKGFIDGFGYGKFNSRRHGTLAHRVSFSLFIGADPTAATTPKSSFEFVI